MASAASLVSKSATISEEYGDAPCVAIRLAFGRTVGVVGLEGAIESRLVHVRRQVPLFDAGELPLQILPLQYICIGDLTVDAPGAQQTDEGELPPGRL
jgi:hypothetical protein